LSGFIKLRNNNGRRKLTDCRLYKKVTDRVIDFTNPLGLFLPDFANHARRLIKSYENSLHRAFPKINSEKRRKTGSQSIKNTAKRSFWYINVF